MRFRALLGAIVLFSIATPTIASAQDEIEAFQNQATATYTRFIQTAITLISSADTLKAAQGAKTDAAKTKKLIEDMQKSLTKVDGNVLEAATLQIQQDSKEMQAMSDATQKLSEDVKKLLLSGLKQYMSGVRQTAVLASELPTLLNAMERTTAALASNPLKFRKVKDSVGASKSMGTGIPAIAKGHVGVVAALKSYMSKQEVKVDPTVFNIGN
jgi:hypothetical protein